PGDAATHDVRAELQKIYEQLLLIQEAQVDVDERVLEHVTNITISGRTLPETVHDLRAFYFLDNVCLKTGEAIKDVEQVARELVEIASALDSSSEFHRGLQESLDETKRALRDNSNYYTLVRRLWRTLEFAVKKVHSVDQPPTGRNYFTQFG